MESLNQTGQQTLAVSSTAVSLTLPTGVNARPKHAFFRVTGSGNVRWQANGTAPTATAGERFKPDEMMHWMEPDYDYAAMIARVQFIREAGDSTVEVAYFS